MRVKTSMKRVKENFTVCLVFTGSFQENYLPIRGDVLFALLCEFQQQARVQLAETEAGLSRVRRGECDACVHCLWSRGTHKNEANNAAARPCLVLCVCVYVCVCARCASKREIKNRKGEGRGRGRGRKRVSTRACV